MTVVDYMPSGGWYTRILVPYLGEEGRYIGLNPDVRAANERLRGMMGDMATTFPPKAAEWTGVPAGRIAAFNSDSLPVTLNGTADRVLIFREIHNLARASAGWTANWPRCARCSSPMACWGWCSTAPVPMRPMPLPTAAGILARKGRDRLDRGARLRTCRQVRSQRQSRRSRRSSRGRVDAAANFSQGDADRARYAAIGESDRMTLLFRKRP